jgi:hypothetical protein
VRQFTRRGMGSALVHTFCLASGSAITDNCDKLVIAQFAYLAASYCASVLDSWPSPAGKIITRWSRIQATS